MTSGSPASAPLIGPVKMRVGFGNLIRDRSLITAEDSAAALADKKAASNSVRSANRSNHSCQIFTFMVFRSQWNQTNSGFKTGTGPRSGVGFTAQFVGSCESLSRFQTASRSVVFGRQSPTISCKQLMFCPIADWFGKIACSRNRQSQRADIVSYDCVEITSDG